MKNIFSYDGIINFMKISTLFMIWSMFIGFPLLMLSFYTLAYVFSYILSVFMSVL